MKTLTATLLLAACLCAAEKLPIPTGAGGAPPKPDSPVKITITLGELVAAQPSLLKLFAADLPVKTAWGLRKTFTAVEGELKRFDEQRTALVKKHSAGKPTVPPENMEALNADYKALTEIPVELGISPIPLSLLGEQIKFSASDMARLEKFLIP